MFKVLLTNILVDNAMFKWIKLNADEKAKKLKMKRLPSNMEKGVGFLKHVKINDIQKAYENDSVSLLPDIVISKYRDTGYYYVIDGRHRTVVAICNDKQQISATLLGN